MTYRFQITRTQTYIGTIEAESHAEAEGLAREMLPLMRPETTDLDVDVELAREVVAR